MKNLIILMAFIFSILSITAQAEDAPPGVQKIVPSLMAFSEDPTLVAAVKKQNAEGKTLADIQAQDKIWKATSGVDDFMKPLLENEAAKKLISIEKTKPYFVESFLMDNQGANVAMTNKTGDYWQGDEAKWKESFKGGKGAPHVGKVEFDESAQAYLVQVSIPVMEAGKAIGAITFGINVDELDD